MIGIFVLSAMLATLAPNACRPLDGVDTLLQSESTRIIWVGEMHGTQEQPALFGDMVCHAARMGRPVIVALERDVEEQPAWDAFLASNGGRRARAAFLRTPSWTYYFQDGRSSLAMLQLAEDLRAARARGAPIDVKTFLPIADAPARDTAEDRERRMAEAILAISRARPDALILVLSGNLHASKGSNTRSKPPYRLAASFLPPDETRTIMVRGGQGEAWNCQGATCGPHPYRSSVGQPRGVVLGGESSGYDGEAFTGSATSYSPPAARPPTPVLLAPTP